jgi:hypothetical protein
MMIMEKSVVRAIKSRKCAKIRKVCYCVKQDYENCISYRKGNCINNTGIFALMNRNYYLKDVDKL